ncbi:MAG: sensor histidine kinase [Rhodothermaceae bacterium]
MEGNQVFITFENPILVGVLVFSIIIVLIYIFSKYFYFPLARKYFRNKKRNNLISKVLFETDPNPVFRIDFDGNLIRKNEAFDKLLRKHKISFDELLKCLQVNTDIKVMEDNFEIKLDKSYYEIVMKRIAALEALQFYLIDNTEIKIKEELICDYKLKVSEIKNREENKFLEQRNELARELHDSINHNLLFAIKKIEMRDKYFPELNDLRRIFEEIRNFSKEIKPENFELEDFTYILYSLIEKYQRATDIKFELLADEKVNSVNSKTLFHLYRIVQELLTNVVKYAEAKNVEISVYSEEEKYFLTVEDDGIGFKPKKITDSYYTSSGLGIINIQERVNEIDGYWSIDSDSGRGTITIIEFSG